MESFVPSTTQEGQGAAQIFQSNPQFADASGIVRGIERGAASLAKQREQQYEEEKERVKKQQELKTKIAKAREGTGVDIIDKGVQKIFENGMKNAYSLDNDDPTGTLTQTLSEMENFKKVTYQIYNKGVDESASKIEKAGGGAAYTGKLYEDVSIAPTFEKALNGNLYSDEELASKVEGGTLLSDLVSDLTIYESDPNFQYKFDVNKVASNVKKNLIDLYGSKSENLVSGADVGNRNVAIKIEDFTPESKKKMKQEAQNNPQLKTAYRNQKMREENLSPTEFDKKYPPEVFNTMFLEDKINPMFEGAERSVITDKKKESGKGITEQDLAIAKDVKSFVNEMQDNPSSIESRRNINKFLAPYGYQVEFMDGNFQFFDMNDNAKSGNIPEGDAVSIYKFIAKNAPEVKLDAINQVEFEDPTKGGNPEVKADIDAIMKAYANKTQDEAKEIAKKFDGVEYVAADELVIDGKSYDITDEKEANEAYVILEEKGYKKGSGQEDSIYIYNGQEYSLKELKDKYGEDFDPSEYEGFNKK
jgi:hypothetical protein